MISIALSIMLSSVAGGFFMYRIQPGRKNIHLLLSFTGAFLLAIALLHVLPELYMHNHNHSIGWYILAGFLLQVILETFSGGIDHGHPVATTGNDTHSHSSKLLILGLYIHAFMEGLPLFTQNNISDPLVLSIIIHTIPVSASFVLLLSHNGFSRNKIMLALLGFTLMPPLGMLTGFALNSSFLNGFKSIALALTVGIFLHISTTILFEAGDHHRIRWGKAIAMLIGILAAWLTLHQH
jgi:zinc and cadmium transporter